VKLFGVRPAREAGHRVELSKEPSHQLFSVVFGAQLIELTEHERQGAVGIGDRPFRKVFTLSTEAFAVADELRTIEVGTETDRGAQNPIGADDACHATPRVGHLVGKNSVSGIPNACQTRPQDIPETAAPLLLPYRPCDDQATETAEHHAAQDDNQAQ
jgi:hypothetical protein